jgi:tetratricopeptide (TPR) repeat protein
MEWLNLSVAGQATREPAGVTAETAEASSSVPPHVFPAADSGLQASAPASLVGADPIPTVVLMEDHEGAYYAWENAGLRDRILVHLDAHIDISWFHDQDPECLLSAGSLREIDRMLAESRGWNFAGVPKKDLLNIGNFIYPALEEGILKQFYWVLPDPMLDGPEGLKPVRKIFEALRRTNPEAVDSIHQSHGAVTAEICGRKVVACSLSQLPAISEPVLLDIDTDFLIIDQFDGYYPLADPSGAKPWIWPEELVERLAQAGLKTDFATIPYSVEGGYTPLAYKHLGDDLAAILRDPAQAADQRNLWALKKEATKQRLGGSSEQALELYREALELAPEDPSIHYQLSHLFQISHLRLGPGDEELARQHFRRAIELDPTYRTAFNNPGPNFEHFDEWGNARGQYERGLRLNPEDPHAHAGMGRVHAREKKWPEAIECFNTALKLGEDKEDVHLDLGRALAKLGEWEAATRHFHHLVDSDESEAIGHFWLGHALFETGRWTEAKEAYRSCLRLGVRAPIVHWRLGRLYLREGMYYKAYRRYRDAVRQYGWFSIRRLLSAPRGLFRRLVRSMRHAPA